MTSKLQPTRTRSASPLNVLTGIVAAFALTVSACGSDAAEEGSAATASQSAGLSITNVWARVSPAMSEHGAAYMTVTSDVDDTLVGASVDPSVASSAEIHEVVAAEMDDMTEDSMGHDEMGHDEMDDMAETDDMGEMPMTMQEVESLAIPAGETIVFEPGGYHVMLLGLAAPLEEGDSFDITLDFTMAGPTTITVDVLAEAP